MHKLLGGVWLIFKNRKNRCLIEEICFFNKFISFSKHEQ